MCARLSGTECFLGHFRPIYLCQTASNFNPREIGRRPFLNYIFMWIKSKSPWSSQNCVWQKIDDSMSWQHSIVDLCMNSWVYNGRNQEDRTYFNWCHFPAFLRNFWTTLNNIVLKICEFEALEINKGNHSIKDGWKNYSDHCVGLMSLLCPLTQKVFNPSKVLQKLSDFEWWIERISKMRQLFKKALSAHLVKKCLTCIFNAFSYHETRQDSGGL